MTRNVAQYTRVRNSILDTFRKHYPEVDLEDMGATTYNAQWVVTILFRATDTVEMFVADADDHMTFEPTSGNAGHLDVNYVLPNDIFEGLE